MKYPEIGTEVKIKPDSSFYHLIKDGIGTVVPRCDYSCSSTHVYINEYEPSFPFSPSEILIRKKDK
jgi:hypothetical protein